MDFDISVGQDSITLDTAGAEALLNAIATANSHQPLLVDAPTLIANTYARYGYNGLQAKEILNKLAPQISASDNPPLVHLLHRALRNHNTLNEGLATDPVPQYDRHYMPPPFLIPEMDLRLEVEPKEVRVISRLTVTPVSNQSSLILDGVGHRVQSVKLNGQPLTPDQYRVTAHELIIKEVPLEGTFQVEVESLIDPFHNKTMEGLYQSGDWLTTQCESEGARRIFYTLDRPDVLTKYRTTIVADPKTYPYRVSNGNLMEETSLPDGKASITWVDPFPKPSYLFAAVLGDFGRLEDTYTTRSGRKVTLEVYMEKGKEERAEFALWALKKAMDFDERHFDREYDLDYLKMVAIADFNMGAMENKGLLIFNESRLLVDPSTGTDADYRAVASVIMHEYAHNWSGNRVTCRNWFQLALKESFTECRTKFFNEELWGKEFARIEAISTLIRGQFPQDQGPLAHPVQVDHYLDSNDIYDATTYVKGTEIFRVLRTLLDHRGDDLFRKAQNVYFSRFDGQAVTFKELLSTVSEVTGKDLSSFERWFYQTGTPTLRVRMEYLPEKKQAVFKVTQSCPHPRTGEEQPPLYLPLHMELLGPEGEPLFPLFVIDFEKREQTLTLEVVDKKPIPLFMHDLTAPIRVDYPYEEDELIKIALNASDPYLSWSAGEEYKKRLLGNEERWPDLAQAMGQALFSKKLSPLAKARLLALPPVRDLEGLQQVWDPGELTALRRKAKHAIADELSDCFELCLDALAATPYRPMTPEFGDDMKARELKAALLSYLIALDREQDVQRVLDYYRTADSFNDRWSALQLLAGSSHPEAVKALEDFGKEWKDDRMIFCFWIQAHAAASNCDVKRLRQVMKHPSFSLENPNHMRACLRVFVNNLGQYHEPTGKAYRFVTSQILRVAEFNPQMASSLAMSAYADYRRLPPEQKELMQEQLERVVSSPVASASLRHIAKKTLEG